MILQPFNPQHGAGISVTPGAASGSSAIGEGSKNLCFTNTGTVLVYVATGDSAVAATVADYPVLAGTQVILSKPQDHTHASYITDGAAGVLKIIPGEGW